MASAGISNLLVSASWHYYCSTKYARLIGKQNPVATLVTLILLSYARLLEISFRALSVGTVNYPNGSSERVWLPDATVKYFSLKHTFLFFVIILVGLVYAVLLFFWHCLLRMSRWSIFKCIMSHKLHAFMETYYAPYKPKYRYWTGMLLFA